MLLILEGRLTGGWWLGGGGEGGMVGKSWSSLLTGITLCVCVWGGGRNKMIHYSGRPFTHQWATRDIVELQILNYRDFCEMSHDHENIFH